MQIIIQAAVFIGIATLLFGWEDVKSFFFWSAVIFVVWAIGILFLSNEDLKKQRQYVRDLALKYQSVLARKRMQLIVEDDYGDIDDIRWRHEIKNFWNKKGSSVPTSFWNDDMARNISADEIAGIIDEVAREGQLASPLLLKFNDQMTGVEYEHYCAEILRKSGWSARVSQASNDQGVDIVAARGGKSAAIQCKRYASPVGNKAVQEVVAGRIFYGSDFAIVVTDNTYTPSARSLAQSSNVHLIHHSELSTLHELLGITGGSQNESPVKKRKLI